MNKSERSSMNLGPSDENPEDTTTKYCGTDSGCRRALHLDTTSSASPQEGLFPSEVASESFNLFKKIQKISSSYLRPLNESQNLKEICPNNSSHEILKKKDDSNLSKVSQKETKYEEEKFNNLEKQDNGNDKKMESVQEKENRSPNFYVKDCQNASLHESIFLDDDNKSEGTDQIIGILEESGIYEKKWNPLVDGSQTIKSQCLNGELLKPYHELPKLKHESSKMFKETLGKMFENIRQTLFVETLNLFTCSLYSEALPKLYVLETIAKMKFGPDFNVKEFEDNDFGVLYHKIGRCHSELGDESRAEQYLYKSMDHLERYYENNPQKPENLLVTCLSSLTFHYLKYKNYDLALDYAERALEFAKMFREQTEGMSSIKLILARCYLNYSDALTSNGRLDEAQENLTKSIEFLELFLNEPENSHLKGSPYYLNAKINRNQGQIFIKYGRYCEAIKVYDEALLILSQTMPQGNKLTEDYMEEVANLRMFVLLRVCRYNLIQRRPMTFLQDKEVNLDHNDRA